MERTISIAFGDGSVNHNNRVFITENVDVSRISNDITLVKENIEDVYHELFDTALEEYNAKQTRKDRKIENYYKHILDGKQEKTFHELVVQIGNVEDSPVGSEAGELTTEILKKYAKNFEQNNPQLRVIALTIHLDEATPHIHLDFVPFATNQKRGLSTRVSLRKALEQQGFKSKGKSNLCTKQWIDSEKERLSIIMKKYGVEWKQLGTHNEHLSVLDYKKEQRQKEITALEKSISNAKEQLAKENKTSVALRQKARNEYAIATRAKEEIERAKKEAERVKHEARTAQEEAELRTRVAKLSASMIRQVSMLNDDIYKKERSKYEKETAKLKSEFKAFQEMVERFKIFVKEEVHKIKDSQVRNTRIEEIEKELFSFNKESENFGDYVKRITQKDKQKGRSL